MSNQLTVGLKVGKLQYDNIEIEGLNLRFGTAVTKRDYKQARVRIDNPESLRFRVKLEAVEKLGASCGYFIDWFEAIKKSHPLVLSQDLKQILKQKMTIFLSNPSLSFDVEGAFPCGWKVSGLSEGQSPQVEVEFAYEKLSRGRSL